MTIGSGRKTRTSSLTPEPGAETKEALAELADTMIGEIERVDSTETPVLDD